MRYLPSNGDIRQPEPRGNELTPELLDRAEAWLIKHPRLDAGAVEQLRRLRQRRYSVYVLVDPRDGRPRYVGCSVNVAKRIANHVGASDTGNPNKRRNAWVVELQDAGLAFRVHVIARGLDFFEASDLEQRAVTRWLAKGWPLLNRPVTHSGYGHVAIKRALAAAGAP